VTSLAEQASTGIAMSDVTFKESREPTPRGPIRAWLRRYRWRLVALFIVASIVVLAPATLRFVKTWRAIHDIESSGAGVRVEPDVTRNATAEYWLSYVADRPRLTNWCRRALSQLRGFGTVKGIGILTPQGGLPNRGLWSSNPMVFDAALQELVHRQQGTFERIEDFTIQGCPVSDEGLAVLNRCPSLTHLNLFEVPNVTPEMISRIDLPRLESLVLVGQNFTDESLVSIAKLPGLRQLTLYNTPATDAGIRELAGHPALWSLDVSYGKLTDAAFGYLSDLPKLYALRLHVPDITDAGVGYLQRLEHVEQIEIRLATEAGFSETRLDDLRRKLSKNWKIFSGGLSYRKNRTAAQRRSSQ
jgi:hypothetical protein